MQWWVWLIIAAVALVVLFVAWRLSNKAGRLDRLHRRIDLADQSLDNALLLRASVVTEVAASMQPDPGSAVLLADAAAEARGATEADRLDRGLVESNLTGVLAGTFDDPAVVAEVNTALGSDELMDELGSATRRVEMSRRFLNDAVRACTAVRQQRMVRWFRLAGHTPWPRPVELDDTPPPGFGVR